MRERNRLGGMIVGIALVVAALATAEFTLAGALVFATLWYMTSDARWP